MLTNDKQPLRCTPLLTANALGWVLLCPEPLVVSWNGSPARDDVRVWWANDPPGEAFYPYRTGLLTNIATSHFGQGIVTFTVPWLFTLPLGWSLMVTGPINSPKDGIVPLTAVVECQDTQVYQVGPAEQSQYLLADRQTFTMNWKFTRPGLAVFDIGDVYCQIIPIRTPTTEMVQIEPTVVTRTQRPSRAAAFDRWAKSRDQFNASLAAGTTQEQWQGDYARQNTHLIPKPRFFEKALQ